MAKKKQPQQPEDDPRLTVIQDRYKYAVARWASIRKEGATDIRYVAGDPWDPRDREQRKQAGRPCLALDELGQYINQSVNEVRANPRAVKFSPRGAGADDDTADFYQNKMREIEYRSKAQIAYTSAFENAVQRSYGFVRVNTKFVSDKSFDQELVIEGFPNPDMVVPDPNAMMPDSSDMQYCFVVESRSVEEFKEEFPDAQIHDFTPELLAKHGDWLGRDGVTVAEYWYIEKIERVLVELKGADGQTLDVYEDELEEMGAEIPAGATIGRRRVVQVPSVKMCLTNGVEILKESEWAGKYIPIVSCYGKVLWSDTGSGPERSLLSLTRLARDPYMLYCYYRTCQAEVVGMTPKIPWMVRKGALTPDQLALLQKSLHEPIAVIQVEGQIEGMGPNQPPEMPMRQPYDPPIERLEMGAEGARRAIQAAMGLTPLPTSAQRQNEKSGVALRRIEESGQKGSYHFIDHYNDMIQQVGAICEDLMDKIYYNAREVGVVQADGTAKTVRINDPQADSQNALKSIRGDHSVTISTGPKMDSEREAASDFADALINSQQVMAVAGPQKAAKIVAKAIKLKNVGAIGDQMADILDPTPQAMQEWPPAAQEAVQMAEQAMQKAQQAIQELQGQLQMETVKANQEMAKAQIDNQTRLQVAQIQAGAKTHDTDVSAKVDLMIAQMQARIDALELAERRREAQVSRQYEAGMAAMAHEQAETTMEGMEGA